MKLFHFSDTPHITQFTPRPVRIRPDRKPEQAWLNGPLVWSITSDFAFLYLFPRDCPRIVVWAKSNSTKADKQKWLGTAHKVAYIETAWLGLIRSARIYRYQLPSDDFTQLDDTGVHVACKVITPIAMETITDLPMRLAETGVILRPLPSLSPIKPVWDSSLHASGIRLRNAKGWTK